MRELVVPTEDGVGLYVEVDGSPADGVTLVFVNGLNLSVHAWAAQRAGLAGLGRLVYYDHRGHGRSGASPWHRTSIGRAARDLQRVLEATVLDGLAVLVGHSLGCTVITALAADHPELFGRVVRGVALVEALPDRWGDVCFGLPPVVTRRMVAWAGWREKIALPRRAAAGRAGVRRTARGVMSASPLTFLALAADALVCDHSSAYATIGRAETVVIAGTGDRYTPDAVKIRMAERIPGARLVLVPGAGHASHRRAAGLVNAEIRDLVARARQRSAG